ncbi:putative protein 28 [Haloarcula hispanica icosahedral virus 2]|uniref:Uncharacterized protein n=1 Tax=Haloarcula hispanica icosahedral virus 2 TaxID=1154689 RepID=H9AZY4_9VIRU|nr:putative protein 28 [Haloarcula hispanica icosahedral virus 2]AFD02309.1 putative protein 28 [Haloarcula hispanica icosahedral virus 2]
MALSQRRDDVAAEVARPAVALALLDLLDLAVVGQEPTVPFSVEHEAVRRVVDDLVVGHRSGPPADCAACSTV